MFEVQISYRFSESYNNYAQVLELTLLQSHLPGENAVQYSAAVPIFIPPGTHYSMVDRGSGFKACPRLLHMKRTMAIEIGRFCAEKELLYI